MASLNCVAYLLTGEGGVGEALRDEGIDRNEQFVSGLPTYCVPSSRCRPASNQVPVVRSPLSVVWVEETLHQSHLRVLLGTLPSRMASLALISR
jgi:hypothetical protein